MARQRARRDGGRASASSRRRAPRPELPERDAILACLAECDGPKTPDEIAAALNIVDEERQRALSRLLQSMQRDGQLLLNRRGGYGPTDKMDLYKGTIIAHADGYGFVNVDEEEEDLYLAPPEMHRVLHSDRVVVRCVGVNKRGRKEAKIVEILQRGNRRVVGRYFEESGVAFVCPHNRRIHQDVLIQTPAKLSVTSGQYVVANLTRQPDRHTQPLGEIVEVLGDSSSVETAIELSLRTHDITCEWPEAVTREAADCAGVPEDLSGREDLRHIPLVTIDGENACDFDDAVYCEPRASGWRLLVAIADVAHYVTPGTALDEEAYRRGNSVYFPGRATPMLPEILSNEWCSLRPDVDRLCLVCALDIDEHGGVTHSRFFKGVMRSAARMTYHKVADIVVKRDSDLRKKYRKLAPRLDDLYQLYHLLYQHRRKRGLLDFGSIETCFGFDGKGNVKSVRTVNRNDAHRVIEECMLAANVAAAEFLRACQIVIPYRAHAAPTPLKIEELRGFLGQLGLSIGGGAQPTTRDYAVLLDQIAQRPDAHIISRVLLRSMQLARYDEKSSEHFGLAAPVYTHFTSPIRRYPDLVVHRAISQALDKNGAKWIYSKSDMQRIAEHCSHTDRRAEEANREVTQWCKCAFMQDKLGEKFRGTISAVTPFGVFVELEKIYIEGLVHVTALPADYYHYDAVTHRLSGERHGRSYRLGDRVRIKVARVNIDDRKIDFELLTAPR